MYESFFGLKEKPFRMTPDPRYFYPSAKHTDALNHMIYAIEERRGFVVITGEIGSGKTTLSRMLFQKLDPMTKTAVIRNTQLSAKDLITMTLEELEIPYKPGSTKMQLIGTTGRDTPPGTRLQRRRTSRVRARRQRASGSSAARAAGAAAPAPTP